MEDDEIKDYKVVPNDDLASVNHVKAVVGNDEPKEAPKVEATKEREDVAHLFLEKHQLDKTQVCDGNKFEEYQKLN